MEEGWTTPFTERRGRVRRATGDAFGSEAEGSRPQRVRGERRLGPATLRHSGGPGCKVWPLLAWHLEAGQRDAGRARDAGSRWPWVRGRVSRVCKAPKRQNVEISKSTVDARSCDGCGPGDEDAA